MFRRLWRMIWAKRIQRQIQADLRNPAVIRELEAIEREHERREAKCFKR